MSRKYHLCAATVFAVGMLASCEYGLHEAFGRPWPPDDRLNQGVLPMPPTIADPLNYRFVATADMHFGKEGSTESAARLSAYAASVDASFIIVAGDLTDRGLPAEFAEWRAWADAAGVPVLAVPGNHDLYNSGWASYREYVGASSYVLGIGDIGFYFVDSASGSLGAAQLRALEAAMITDPRRKILVSHYPIVGYEGLLYYRLVDNAERLALLSLCAENRVALVASGHSHHLEARDYGPFVEWVASSALSSGLGEGCGILVHVINGLLSIEEARF